MADADLFGKTPPRKRAANQNASAPDDRVVIRWTLTPTERNILKRNTPGKSGEMGGYQKTENELIEMLDGHADTVPNKQFCIDIDKDMAWRLMRYIQGYGEGGPNERLRKAFRRFIGIGH